MQTLTTIVKFLIRRGTNEDRKTIVLAQGELGATTDTAETMRLFIGDGVTYGGRSAGCKFFMVASFTDDLSYVEPGDIVFSREQSRLYALTGVNYYGTYAGDTLSGQYMHIGR